MDTEKVDVLDDKGKKTGKTILKTEAHRLRLWHRASHVWIYNSKGDILLQKRAECKPTFPGLWDISTAGHVSAGQSYEEAAVREAFEEIGIIVKASELKKIEVKKIFQDGPEEDFHNREFVQVFLLKRELDVSNLKLQEEEVECVKFVPLDALESELLDPKKFKKYTPLKDYFLEIIKRVRKELENS
jgi:isopentenyl-diphosphate Delta-isomerase